LKATTPPLADTARYDTLRMRSARSHSYDLPVASGSSERFEQAEPAKRA
jgi:hypothetical protein